MKKQHCAHDKVLIVGTTPDYIDWIQKESPDRALFLTEPEIRKRAKESSPGPENEIVVQLDNISALKETLKNHLKKWNQRISGIACFDCESMEIASQLATTFKADYPDIQSIRNCRDKYVSKQIWKKNGIRCPCVCPVNSVEATIDFLKTCQNGIVLKPLCGSGSELVFYCKFPRDCSAVFEILKDGLTKRRQNRLFNQKSARDYLMLAEEYVIGPEYSCDFIIENDKISIIRLSRKIKFKNQPFGTASGYILPVVLPDQLRNSDFEKVLLNAARSLGLKRAICMVDFILKGYQPVFIEMTPRPGGDCLPILLREACGTDILGLTMEFSEKKWVPPINGALTSKPHVGLQIHAHKAGVFNGFNADLIADDKRIKQIHIIREIGHKIKMPPDDYDSWLLGYIIVEPDNMRYLEAQSLLIQKRFEIDIQQ